MRKTIPVYMQWKYEADKNLVKPMAFDWIILRPGGLTNNPGTGTASVGRTHLGKIISIYSHLPCSISDQSNPQCQQETLALLVDRKDAACDDWVS